MNEKLLNKYIRPVLSALGYYKTKAAIKMHFYLKHLRREDAAKRVQIDVAIALLPDEMLTRDNELVVSLTSYGHRITDTLPYTLYSLLTQEVLPGRIVVYLSKDEVCGDSLPDILKKLEKCGVEFYYVKDTRSYKKLIPALPMFPDNPILTVDDDMYYDKSFIKTFLDAYEGSNKRSVLGTVGRMVTRDASGRLLLYSQWEETNDENVHTKDVSFYGCGGCLYPPHLFDEEILNEDVFMRLAPYADDLWFWVMEQRSDVKTYLIGDIKRKLYVPVDRTTLFELDRPDCLTSLNDGTGRNDIQLKALLEYYKMQ